MSIFADRLARQAEKQRQWHEQIFGPESEPTEPSTTPQGDVDAGKGEPDDAIYEMTEHGRMRVWPIDNDNRKD